ncbi:hypothetical protein PV703_19475 [Streptomyces sp. ME01-24h]|nr:hypothetical protein [Streptomyces sp. ME19-03-3]MDX3355446.1 hypothetical protein [Streptomyces sp. ME01-24h]
MADHKGTHQVNKTVHAIAGILLLAAGGVACSSGDGAEGGGGATASSRAALPAVLCGTSVSTEPISRFHQAPVSEVVANESTGGGLRAPLTAQSVGGDEGYCAVTVDGEVIQVGSQLRSGLVDEKDIAQRVKAGGSGLDWGPARGYITSGGGTELAVLTAPCRLEGGTFAVDVSVSAPTLRGSGQEVLKAREAMAELAADAARYVAEHSAKCQDAGGLPSTAPTVRQPSR